MMCPSPLQAFIGNNSVILLADEVSVVATGHQYLQGDTGQISIGAVAETPDIFSTFSGV